MVLNQHQDFYSQFFYFLEFIILKHGFFEILQSYNQIGKYLERVGKVKIDKSKKQENTIRIKEK